MKLTRKTGPTFRMCTGGSDQDRTKEASEQTQAKIGWQRGRLPQVPWRCGDPHGYACIGAGNGSFSPASPAFPCWGTGVTCALHVQPDICVPSREPWPGCRFGAQRTECPPPDRRGLRSPLPQRLRARRVSGPLPPGSGAPAALSAIACFPVPPGCICHCLSAHQRTHFHTIAMGRRILTLCCVLYYYAAVRQEAWCSG